jgi:hypothetical protein
MTDKNGNRGEVLMNEGNAPHFILDIGEPRACGAGGGAVWIGQAWALFKSSWLEFLLAYLIVLLIQLVLNWIPLGSLITVFVTPLLIAGIMQMARKARLDMDPGLGDLFTAFREPWRKRLEPLLLLGVLSLVFGMSILVLLITALLSVVKLSDLMPLAHMSTLDVQHQHQLVQHFMQQVQQHFIQSWEVWMVAGLAMLVLAAFYSCAVWLALPLVWFSDTKLTQALRLSLRATGRNVLALIVFVLLAWLLYLVALIPVGLGLLIVLPLFQITTYTAFEQIFLQQDTESRFERVSSW